MRRTQIFGALLIALALAMAFGCETSRQDPDTGDSIQINSVSNRPSGRRERVQVAVEYTLASSDYGDLDIAFNTGVNPADHFYVTNATKVVAAGTGKYEFNLPISVTNWPASSTVFSVYVSLSVSQHSIPWRPLADDTAEFTFDDDEEE